MERWQLSTKELARYSVIENTIEGYLKADRAAEMHEERERIFISRERV